MLNDIYNTKILELAGNIPRLGRLEEAHATSRQHSKLCGSTIIVDLAMRDGKVSDYAHDVKACALGQAAAAIVANHVIGATAAELRDIRDRVRAMLKTAGRRVGGSGHSAAGARVQGPSRLDAARVRRCGTGRDRSGNSRLFAGVTCR